MTAGRSRFAARSARLRWQGSGLVAGLLAALLAMDGAAAQGRKPPPGRWTKVAAANGTGAGLCNSAGAHYACIALRCGKGRGLEFAFLFNLGDYGASRTVALAVDGEKAGTLAFTAIDRRREMVAPYDAARHAPLLERLRAGTELVFDAGHKHRFSLRDTGAGIDRTLAACAGEMGRGLAVVPELGPQDGAGSNPADKAPVPKAAGPQANAPAGRLSGRATKFELVRQTGHTNAINAVAFSPDGKLVLSGSQDGTLRLWDKASGRLVRAFSSHEPSGEGSSGVQSVTFSPDGRRLLSGGAGSARLWDASTGESLLTLEEDNGWVGVVAFSPDGRQLFSVSDGGALRSWDASSGKMLRSFVSQSHEINGSGQFSSDGSRVLVTTYDNGVKILSISGGEILHKLKAHTGRVAEAAFSPDERFFASAGADATVILWDAITGQQLRTFKGHVGRVESVAFSGDGRQLLSGGGEDNTLRLWDATSGRLLRTFSGHSEQINSVAFSPGGDQVLSGSQDGTLRLWSKASGEQLRVFQGGILPVFSVAVSSDRSRIAVGTGSEMSGTLTAGSEDEPSALQIWDATSGMLVRSLGEHAGIISSVSISQDGGRLLSGGSFGKNLMRQWDPKSGRLIKRVEAFPIAFSATGGQFLTSDGPPERSPDTLRLWDVASDRIIRSFSVSAERAIFSPDGNLLISSSNKDIQMWDIKSGKLLRSFGGRINTVGDPDNEDTLHRISVIAMSPDGRSVLVGGHDATLGLWDAANGKLRRKFQEPGKNTFTGYASHRIASLAFSPDGRRVLSGRADGVLRLWDVETGSSLRSLSGHADEVNQIAFSSDGRIIVSGSSDGTVKIWQAETGLLLATLAGTKDGESIALTPEGFFSASKDGASALHLVRGLGVTTIDQVHQSLFNPDLVREKLAGDPNGEVKAAAATLDLEKVVDSGPAPTVVLEPVPGGGRPAADLVTLKARITDGGKGIGRIEWRVNGITVAVETPGAGAGPDYAAAKEIALDPGDNAIEVVAYNASNLLASLPARTTVKFTGPADAVKPVLHILAIGINKYVDQGSTDPATGGTARFAPLALAVKDAQMLAADLERAAGGRYAGVRVTLALDEDATRGNLDRIVDRLAGEIHPRDSFVLFAAGHGFSHDGRFYFIPQDYSGGADPAALAARAVGQDRLQDWLANRIKAKRAVILLDTCESGALIAGHLRSRSADAASEAGVGRLHEATGRPVLTAAALGQFALEGLIARSGNQHGVFTYAVLDALRSGDSNGNGSIELSELVAHVQVLVPKLAADLGGTGRTTTSAPLAAPGTRQSARFGSRGEDFSLVGRMQ